MKRKLKLLAYGASSALMAAPLAVSAQFAAPSGTGLPSDSLYRIISNIMYWLLAIVGIVGVIGFAIAGLLYLTAAGDDTRIGKAKNAMLYSILGVIVALAGLVALRFASGLLGASSQF